ncbi:hypothetical protein OPV22_008700 [Ensete ventricosum]|uniref:Uncharacterized protein n=1 Tax=Ensete ventricosum TaxID=4639 RepID=A0AAV8RH67_ENSVE|nr:hypothetical protein OPV22_008700 [Ensete ventricosum]
MLWPNQRKGTALVFIRRSQPRKQRGRKGGRQQQHKGGVRSLPSRLRSRRSPRRPIYPTLIEDLFGSSDLLLEQRVVMDKDNEQGTLESQLIQKNTKWKHEFECHQSQVEKLEEKLMEVKIDMKCAEEDTKDLELLWRRVKTTATMLTYLKSKARIMAIPHLACVSCGIKHQEGIGFVDKHGLPLSEWSTIVNLSSLESSDEMSQLASNLKYGPFDANDGAYFSETLKSTRVVAEVMESLIKRAIKAETEAATEKEKVKLGLEENKRKTLQIQGMTLKVEEMEKFALGTNTLLNEMRQKVTDMVEETSRQRQRAAENEQELRRVKQDFDSLRLLKSFLTG